jgi:hypothetical protein
MNGDAPLHFGDRRRIACCLEQPCCVFAHSDLDGGQPGADCLTPQLRTNGRLATVTNATCPDRRCLPGYAKFGEERSFNDAPSRGLEAANGGFEA